MVRTRAQKLRADLTHVLDNIWCLAADSPLRQHVVQNQYTDVRELLALDNQELAALQFEKEIQTTDASGNITTTTAQGIVPARELTLVKALRQYLIGLSNDGTSTQAGELTTVLTIDEFDAYRSGEYLQYVATPSLANRTFNSNARTPAEEFKRGTKRDVNVYPVLRDEKQWFTWKREWTATALAQGIDDVMDPNFIPSSDPDQQALFEEKQKFAWAVLCNGLKTDTGKNIIRKWESTRDAQKALAELVTHHESSTKSQLDSGELLTYITTAKLGETSWNGTTRAFILHWENQMTTYESLVDTADHFSKSHKLAIIQNAVYSISDLRRVKLDSDLAKTKTGTAFTYEQYMTLLKSAATQYDRTLRPKSSSLTRRRAVYYHETDRQESFDASFDVDCPEFDAETPIDTVQAYATMQRLRNVRSPATKMAYERWTKLSPEGQGTWDKLSDQDKIVVLGNNPATRPPRQVNEHAIADDSTLPEPTSPDDPNTDSLLTPPPDDDGASTTLLANATKSHWKSPAPAPAPASKKHTVPPADIRRVLSSSEHRTSTNGQSQSARKELMIDGVPYVPKFSPSGRSATDTRQVSFAYSANMHYTISANQHAEGDIRGDSLVDRGCNGGVAGEDTRLIAVTGRTVKIQGIDDHQLPPTPIGTVGATVDSHRGPVIVIFHQYAWHGRGKTIHSVIQLEQYQNDVDDRAIRVGGKQRIITLDGYIFPINIKQGLPYLKLRPYTDHEWETLPHVIVTSDYDWDPSVADLDLQEDDNWYDSLPDIENCPHNELFDEFGNYRKVEEYSADVNFADVNLDAPSNYNDGELYFFDASESLAVNTRPQADLDLNIDRCIYDANEHRFLHSERLVQKQDPDYESLRPYFAFLPVDRIKKTFERTTQLARMPAGTRLKWRFRSPYPALNVDRRNEPVATDTVFSDTPAVDTIAWAW